jgi:hypothetical protein
MKLPKRYLLIALLNAGLVISWPGLAVTVGHIDTFEDGTTDNWLVGLLGSPHPAPPVNIPSGGPTGVDDNYLLLTAVGGGGPGSRLTAINLLQWAGDYITAGIGGIRMDLNNLGSSDLDLRLLLSNPLAGPPTDIALSSDPIHLPAGSGWTSVLFPVTPPAFTAVLGSIDAAFMNATEFRILHSPNADFPGPPINALLGVDNIQAIGRTVPEIGSTAWLLGIVLSVLMLSLRCRDSSIRRTLGDSGQPLGAPLVEFTPRTEVGEQSHPWA